MSKGAAGFEDRKDNNLKDQAVLTIPVSEYWVLGNTPIPHWTPYAMMSGVIFGWVSLAIGIYTNWWQLLLYSTLNFFFIQNWFIGFPAVFITVAFLYVRHDRRSKRRTAAEIERQRIRRYQDAISNQGK